MGKFRTGGEVSGVKRRGGRRGEGVKHGFSKRRGEEISRILTRQYTAESHR